MWFKIHASSVLWYSLMVERHHDLNGWFQVSLQNSEWRHYALKRSFSVFFSLSQIVLTVLPSMADLLILQKKFIKKNIGPSSFWLNTRLEMSLGKRDLNKAWRKGVNRTLIILSTSFLQSIIIEVIIHLWKQHFSPACYTHSQKIFIEIK